MAILMKKRTSDTKLEGAFPPPPVEASNLLVPITTWSEMFRMAGLISSAGWENLGPQFLLSGTTKDQHTSSAGRTVTYWLPQTSLSESLLRSHNFFVTPASGANTSNIEIF
jgi:hypothetical protein